MAGIVKSKNQEQCKSYDQRMKNVWFLKKSIDINEAIILNLQNDKDEQIRIEV